MTWVESEDGRYHIAELMPPSATASTRPASYKLMSRIVALFKNGGPRGSQNSKFSVVSVRMLRNEHLSSAFASTVQTMEQRMVRVGVSERGCSLVDVSHNEFERVSIWGAGWTRHTCLHDVGLMSPVVHRSPIQTSSTALSSTMASRIRSWRVSGRIICLCKA